MNKSSPNVEKIVIDHVVFGVSIAWSVPEIFAIKVYSCPKSSALLITLEPLHLAWWNFARTTTRQPVKSCWISRSRWHRFFGVFCVGDSAATRGQYLALSKAWWSRYMKNWSQKNCVLCFDWHFICLLKWWRFGLIWSRQTTLLYAGPTVTTRTNQKGIFILRYNDQPSRSTQPGHPFECWRNECQINLGRKQTHRAMH